MATRYQISDEDIEAALRYCRLHISKDATREDAKAWLENKLSEVQEMGKNDPEKLESLKKKLDANKDQGNP